MLCEAPTVDGARVTVGTLGTVETEGASGPIEVDTLPIVDSRLRLAWPDTLWRVRIPFDKALTVRLWGAL